MTHFLGIKMNRGVKKTLVSLMLFLVVFTSLAVPVASAQVGPTGPPSTWVIGTSGEGPISTQVITPVEPEPEPEPPETTENGCKWWQLGCQIAYFFTAILPAILAGFLLMFTSWFLGAAGLMLDFVFEFTVVNMNDHIGDIKAIDVAWKVMRDLANLFFIFILLYISIGIILGTTSSNASKLLVNVILVALLLNFSLFFTKIIIDASNIVTVGFYNKMAVSTASGEPRTIGLAAPFMNKLGLADLFGGGVAANLIDKSGGNTWKILIMGIFGSILFLVTGFVFLAISFMFIIRYVILIFLMIFSPLAFAAAALPNDKYSSLWWNKLWDNIIFAPVFMIMMWVVLIILEQVLAPGGANISGVVTGSATISGSGTLATTTGVSIEKPSDSSIGMLMNFIIIITMMVATLIVAKMLGAKGADSAISYGKKLRGWGTSLVGRNVIGRPARYLDEKLGEKRFFNLTPIQDLREKTVGALATAKFGGGYSGVDSYKEGLQRKERRLDISNEVEAQKHVEIATQAHEEAKEKIEKAKTITDEKEREAKLKEISEDLEIFDDNAQKAMAKLTPKAFAKIAEKRFYDKNFMRYATTAQYLEVQKGDRLNENKKRQVTQARFAYIETALENLGKEKEAYLAQYGKQIEELENKILSATAANEEAKKITDEKEREAKLKETSDEKKRLEEELAKIEKNEPGLGEIYEDIRRKGVKEFEILNQHKPELFKNATFVSSIGSQTIQDIRNSDAFGRLQKDEIRVLKYDAIFQEAILLENLEKEISTASPERKVEIEKAIARANRRMDRAWGGKNKKEIGAMRGRIWRKKASLRRLDRGTLPEFADKDNVEKETIMKHFVEELKNHIAGKRKLTNQNIKAIEWLLNVNAGRNFYPPLANEVRDLAKKAGGIKVIDEKEVKDE